MNRTLFSRRSTFVSALCAALLLAAPSPAQIRWMTTAGAYPGIEPGGGVAIGAKLRVLVFPAYLEVEEDLELTAGGNVHPENSASTLQAGGTFTLPQGAVLTGALVWEGDRVLQARLLDKVRADSAYDELADRDSAPGPRPVDPLLLERTAANTYSLKVYPLALNAPKRVRLRYQLPPRLGADGFEMVLQGAFVSAASNDPVAVTLEARAGATTVRFIEGGSPREMTLPRSLFLPRAALRTGAPASQSIRILPSTADRQVQVKTSFGTGAFKGHYLNLYGAVDEATLKALGRIEVVVFWKWHNPLYWKNSQGYIAEAGSQAASLLNLYGALGVPGTGVGLLHDDSHRPQKAFAVAAQGEPAHAAALAYLQTLQGDAIGKFVDSLAAQGGSSGPPPLFESRSRFLANMRIVKTLYSPEEGITRHLILMSSGPDYAPSDIAANTAFDSIFADRPVSVGMLGNRPFTQAGLDFTGLRQARPIAGASATLQGTALPVFPAVTFYATVRNALKAYDFSLTCAGGLAVSCPSLEFHGKAQSPWSDTVSWEAFTSSGKLLGRSKTRPRIITADSDTATALLWAGSSAPFSETRESPLGATYGFVDGSGSLLAMAGDSLPGSQGGAYADSGVPRAEVVIVPNPPTVPRGPINVRGTAADASRWRIERAGADMLLLRIPGLDAGAPVELELIALDGKRVGLWKLTAEAGRVRWNISGVRPGTYLVRVRGPNVRGERLLTF